MIRTIQYNITRTRVRCFRFCRLKIYFNPFLFCIFQDKFLHTNLLATLANMSSFFKNLSPYVSQKMITLFEKLSKRLNKILNQPQTNNVSEDQTVPSSDRDTDIATTSNIHDSMHDLSIYEEVLRMILEIINSSLSSQLIHNSNLVYTLLYNRNIFEPFQSHPSFQDIIFNIETILTYFSNRIASIENHPTVAQVYDIIQSSSLHWPIDKLKVSFDVKLEYVFEYFCFYLNHTEIS